MANTYVYIDGFNLYYGCLKRTPYKWLDLAKLSHMMLPSDTIQQIKYFTARVSARSHNPSAPIDQQVYLRALRTIPNLEIIFGHFLTHSVPMMLTGTVPPKKVWVDKTEEKGSDVNLAAHLVCDAFQKRFEVAVLITNDSDLAEPVRIITKELGMRTTKVRSQSRLLGSLPEQWRRRHVNHRHRHQFSGTRAWTPRAFQGSSTRACWNC